MNHLTFLRAMYKGSNFSTSSSTLVISGVFLAVSDLRCCTGFTLVVESRGYSLVAVQGLLTVVASPAVEHGL